MDDVLQAAGRLIVDIWIWAGPILVIATSSFAATKAALRHRRKGTAAEDVDELGTLLAGMMLGLGFVALGYLTHWMLIEAGIGRETSLPNLVELTETAGLITAAMRAAAFVWLGALVIVLTSKTKRQRGARTHRPGTE